jgi:hypothetical protein
MNNTRERVNEALKKLSTHHVTQHLYWQFLYLQLYIGEFVCYLFMLIAPLIREPGRVVSTGRALVPTQPNSYDLFFFISRKRHPKVFLLTLHDE